MDAQPRLVMKQPASARRPQIDMRRLFRAALPALSLAIVLLAIDDFNPRAISYFGFTLMLNLAIPVALATAAQICIITVSDLDLSIGAYVGFVASVTATWLPGTPLLGIAVILASIVLYGALGALVQLRQLPSIVVTLGMSFVWLGLALLVRPQPGGASPGWLTNFMAMNVPYVPFPIVAAIVLAVVMHLVLMRTAFGAVLRGAGGNPAAVARSGWSLLRIKTTAYAMAGVLGSLAGMALVGCQYGEWLHAALHRRGHPGWGRVHRRPHLPHRRGHRRVDAATGRRRAQFLPYARAAARLSYSAGMAGRRAGPHPHSYSGDPRPDQPG
jgi:ribose transport system permease protein